MYYLIENRLIDCDDAHDRDSHLAQNPSIDPDIRTSGTWFLKALSLTTEPCSTWLAQATGTGMTKIDVIKIDLCD
jgi:hypothetical protein